MTTDKLTKAQKKAAKDLGDRFGAACVLLTRASITLAREYRICPLCLLYATGRIAEGAEEAGSAHHINCSAPIKVIHPEHKTVL
jgi:hypothetical protein